MPVTISNMLNDNIDVDPEAIRRAIRGAVEDEARPWASEVTGLPMPEERVIRLHNPPMDEATREAFALLGDVGPIPGVVYGIERRTPAQPIGITVGPPDAQGYVDIDLGGHGIRVNEANIREIERGTENDAEFRARIMWQMRGREFGHNPKTSRILRQMFGQEPIADEPPHELRKTWHDHLLDPDPFVETNQP